VQRYIGILVFQPREQLVGNAFRVLRQHAIERGVCECPLFVDDLEQPVVDGVGGEVVVAGAGALLREAVRAAFRLVEVAGTPGEFVKRLNRTAPLPCPTPFCAGSPLLAPQFQVGSADRGGCDRGSQGRRALQRRSHTPTLLFGDPHDLLNGYHARLSGCARATLIYPPKNYTKQSETI
jgi:hypothetical protein